MQKCQNSYEVQTLFHKLPIFQVSLKKVEGGAKLAKDEQAHGVTHRRHNKSDRMV
jgi:hypothetical protein